VPGADGRLPRELAERFTVVRILSAPTAPATVLLVHEAEHGERVLKLYPPTTELDTAVAALLPELHQRNPHLIEVFEVGTTAGGIGYELMEYVAGGDLRTHLEREPGGLEPDQVRDAVGQLAGAIETLHEEGVWHKDVKPRNVLIRTLVPLNLALADFDISGLRTAEWQFQRGPGTALYMSPQALTAEFDDPTRDWWALGISVAEMVLGRHPLQGFDPEVLRLNYADGRGVDLADVADRAPRDIYRLCQGLLRQNRSYRWGVAEVRDWLAGEEPEVVTTAAGSYEPPAEEPVAVAHPFRLDDRRTVYSRVELAAALAEDWHWAAIRFCSPRAPDRERLRDWLLQFEDDVPGRDALLRRMAQAQENPDVLLLRLLHWLHPTAPPAYRHRVLTPQVLPRLARDATAPPEIGEDARLVLLGLWRHRVLQILTDARHGAELAAADRRWREQHDRWRAFVGVLPGDGLAGALPPDDDPVVLGYLLWLVTDTQGAADWLRVTAMTAAAALPERVDWFDELLRGPDPLGPMCCVLLNGHARIQSERLHEEREVERRRAEFERQVRRRELAEAPEAEWYRRQRRPTAFGWAVLGLAVVVVTWTVLIGTTDVLPFAGGPAVNAAWVCAVLATIVLAAAEAWLVAEIGGPYYPRFSLIALVVHAGGRVGRAVLARGGWFVALVAACAAGLVVVTGYQPWVLPLVTAVGHLLWTRVRHRRWQAERAAREERLAQAREERWQELEAARQRPAPGAGRNEGAA
jgi:hypothetical protein